MTKIDLTRKIDIPDWVEALTKPTRIGSGELERQWEEIGDEVLEAVHKVLPTGKYTLGPYLKQFEQEFAAFSDSKFAIGISSGTAALHIALEAMGVGPGDEVITVCNTYVATAFAASYCGATPVFVDIDPKTYNLTAELVEKKITPKTKVILPVHLYGHVVDMDPIMELAKKHNLYVLEDASHAHGGYYKGRRVGSLGHAAAFSFYPSKNMGAYGDGGIITTSDPDLNEKIRMLRYVGQRVKFIHEVIGFQDRLDEIQAAMLSVKLRHLDDWNNQRRHIASIYDEMLKDTPLQLPQVADYCHHVYYSYATVAPSEEERKNLLIHLANHDIGGFAMYPILVPMQGAYEFLGYKEEDFPVGAPFVRRVLNLPIFENFRDDEAIETAKAILAYYDRA
ncbi:MAG: DegT/DnrJ/EryC1/StrS family aminotransferase [Anaerolineae bacterium]|jgi:dTDP-4-amino-4,6-dideoxygalactose transaminase|nr:DegT/DnrJ/EryC1/StrS family aminotransferase [Anaerolineae bacterium]